MREKAILIQKAPYVAVKYTEVKLYIPKEIKNGKKVPSLKKAWYVWFRYRNPEIGILDSNSKFNFKTGINQYKTIAQRKKAGLTMVSAFQSLLDKGFNPYENTMDTGINIDFDTKNSTVKEAIEKALTDKKNTWAKSTADNILLLTSKFIEFAEKYNFAFLPASDLKRQHVIEFLNSIKQTESLTSVNNYRGALSSVFSQMVQNNNLPYNFP